MEGNGILLALVGIPFLGALISYGIGRKNKTLRDCFADGVTILEFLIFLGLFIQIDKIGNLQFVWKGFCGLGMSLKLDGFRVLYGLVASFMWMMTTLFSKEYLAHYRNRNRYYLFVLFTLGATIGVFLSSDLYTTFIFFEIMSFTSYVWVAQEETAGALRAAETYLAIAVMGGLVMLMGLFLLYDIFGTLNMHTLHEFMISGNVAASTGRLYAAGLCLLFGFGAKAGAFPLHIWLPKAHPVAPAPASALLSGVLTKAGVFGIIVVSCQLFYHDGVWGTLILTIGVITMFLGAVLALFSVNLKRTLACSSLSQIGFIMVGIGMTGLLGEENALAVRGSFLHMVNHSLIKLVLFMAAGVVFMNLHELSLNEIRGFGRKKPLLNLIFLSGALGIAGVPLFNGYVSKTLLHESIVEYRELLAEGVAPILYSASAMTVIEWIFLISGGLTAAYMTKLYICIFIERNTDAAKQAAFDEKKNYVNPVSAFALCGGAAVIPVLGVIPSLTMDKLADLGQGFFAFEGEAHAVSYFSLTNLKGSVISLCIGALVYLFVVRTYMMGKDENQNLGYQNCWNEKLDLENLVYRPVLTGILPFIGGFACSVCDKLIDCVVTPFSCAVMLFGARTGDSLLDSIVVALRKTVYRDSPLTHELEEGTRLTHILGSILDHLRYGVNCFKSRKSEKKPCYEKYYEHKLARKHDQIRENGGVITRSMSFGLFLFCIGFVLTVLYLLLII